MPISTERTEQIIELTLREKGLIRSIDPVTPAQTIPWRIPPQDELIDYAVVRLEPRGIDPDHSLLRFTKGAIEGEAIIIDCTE